MAALKVLLTATCSLYWQWLLQPLTALETYSVQRSHDPSCHGYGYYGAIQAIVQYSYIPLRLLLNWHSYNEDP